MSTFNPMLGVEGNGSAIWPLLGDFLVKANSSIYFYDCARIGANIEDWRVNGRYYSLAENCLDTASTFTKERDIKVLEEVKSHFKPEFLNRLDEIIIFNKLEKNNLKSIIENQLAILKNRLAGKNIKILFDLEVVNLLSEKGYSREYGARPLKRLIEKEIGDIIADALINNQIKENSYFTVGVKEGKFKLKITS